MNKVSQVLRYAAKVIREQEEDKHKLLEVIETNKKTEKFRKLATIMAEQGLIDFRKIDTKTEALMYSDKDPMIIEQAMELALQKRASIIEDTLTDINVPTNPAAKINQVLLDEDDED